MLICDWCETKHGQDGTAEVSRTATTFERGGKTERAELDLCGECAAAQRDVVKALADRELVEEVAKLREKKRKRGE